jgi:hypothetical protein
MNLREELAAKAENDYNGDPVIALRRRIATIKARAIQATTPDNHVIIFSGVLDKYAPLVVDWS